MSWKRFQEDALEGWPVLLSLGAFSGGVYLAWDNVEEIVVAFALSIATVLFIILLSWAIGVLIRLYKKGNSRGK